MKPTLQHLFLPYQKAWILDNAKLKLWEKSRQIGASWIEAYRRVRQTSLQGAKYDSWISSRDKEQAKLFIEDAKFWARLLNMAATDIGELMIDEEKGLQSFCLKFANGKCIYSMSSNPDAQAGKRGSRTLDEFALHKDQRRLYAIAKPGIQWGGQMSLFSTHRGTTSFFHQLITEAKHEGNSKKFSLHKTTIVDAVDQGLWRKIRATLPDDDQQKHWSDDDWLAAQKRECPDQDTWLEEYMCEPCDGDSILSPELILSCVYEPGEKWETAPRSGAFYAGMDIGRHRDLSVIWLLEKVGSLFMTRKVIEMHLTPFHQQRAVLWDIMDNYHVTRLAMDKNGLGEQIAEETRTAYGPNRVFPVALTMESKQTLAFPLQAAFQAGAIRVPGGVPIERDLRSVKKVVTAAGNQILRAECNNGHADRFWALALAHHAGITFTDAGVFGLFSQITDRLTRSHARRHR